MTQIKTSKKQWKEYTGYLAVPAFRREVLLPRDKYGNPDKCSALDILVYAIARLEGPVWGAVQNYDGVGMSAGILHNIAVQRNGQQGSLGPLLRRMEISLTQSTAGQHLWEFLRNDKIYVAQDGKFRDTTDGSIVKGPRLLTCLSGHPKGKPSTKSELAKSKLAAETFSRAFCYAEEEQRSYALDWVLKSYQDEENFLLYRLLGGGYAPLEDKQIAPLQAWLMLPHHLEEYALLKGQPTGNALMALLTYHAYSVNAPGMAKKIMDRVLYVARWDDEPKDLSKKLIRAFGTTKYGKWADTPDGANRYDRTRKVLAEFKFFNPDIMPVNL
jgi:hypothetical protein